jgi:hypothetical protein
MITFKFSNRKKWTPDRWYKFGDACLFAIVPLDMAIKQSSLPEEIKVWAGTISLLLCSAGKFITRFFHDSNEKQPTP